MKGFCIDCEHVVVRRSDYKCKKHPLYVNLRNHVTGVLSLPVYGLCERYNKDGECTLFEEKEQDGKGNNLQEDS